HLAMVAAAPFRSVNWKGHALMSGKSTLVLLFLALGWSETAPLRADEASDKKQLAQQAFGVFNTFCIRCHHGDKPESKVEDYEILDYSSLTKQRKDKKDKPWAYIAPSKPDGSRIWQRLNDSDEPMSPAEVKERPGDKEKAILKKWIEAGAPKEGFGPAG